MRIKVKLGKQRKEKHSIRRINLIFPNSFFKSRLAVKIIRQGIENNEKQGSAVVIPPEYINRQLLKTLYAALKGVIKSYGHFNIVEVDAADGTKVIIRV